MDIEQAEEDYDNPKLFSGVDELLALLKRAKIPVAIATSNIESVARKALGRIAVHSHFYL